MDLQLKLKMSNTNSLLLLNAIGDKIGKVMFVYLGRVRSEINKSIKCSTPLFMNVLIIGYKFQTAVPGMN